MELSTDLPALRSLADWGASESVLARLADAMAAGAPRVTAPGAEAPSGALPGRVARVDRIRVDVATAAGIIRSTDGGMGPLCPGDWVIVVKSADAAGQAGHQVIAVIPRWSSLMRSTGPRSLPQILAANMDEVWVIVPVDQAPEPARLERLLILAFDSGATPVVVLTKADLADDAPLREAVKVAGPGVAVLAISSISRRGIGTLVARVGPGQTAALIGVSGAGKSSLINALVGDGRLATGAVRAADGKGRHTTTWRELVGLPRGGAIIDTPGLRSLGLWLDEGGIDATFREISLAAEQCRFTDCSHTVEPGCAVLAAVAAGTIDRRRLERYLELHDEVGLVSDNHDARLATERSRPSPADTGRPRSRRH